VGFQWNYVNNISTTLNGGITNSATSLIVASSTGFPTSFPFMIAMEDSTELIKVTNVVGTTWTIARGQESSTATSHANGATIRSVITAAITDTFVQTQTGTPVAQTGEVLLSNSTSTPTIEGRSSSTSGIAVKGLESAASGVVYGGYFDASASTSLGVGVYGNGGGSGLKGDTANSSGIAVFGTASANTGFTKAGYFDATASTSGIGSTGLGGLIGALGQNNVASGWGVRGINNASSDGTGAGVSGDGGTIPAVSWQQLPMLPNPQ
jgi:hypothetical protein